MANFKWFTKVHRRVFLLTGGLIGGRLAGQDMALLHTIGRKSGQKRIVPLVYYSIDDRGPIVLGSNNGSPKPPIWWLNLQANAKIEVQTRGEKFWVEAEEIEPDLREQAWQKMMDQNPIIKDYPEKSGRVLPIVLLKRLP